MLLRVIVLFCVPLCVAGAIVAPALLTAAFEDTPEHPYAFMALPIDASDPDCIAPEIIGEKRNITTGKFESDADRYRDEFEYMIYPGGWGVWLGRQYLLRPSHPLFAAQKRGDAPELRACS